MTMIQTKIQHKRTGLKIVSNESHRSLTYRSHIRTWPLRQPLARIWLEDGWNARVQWGAGMAGQRANNSPGGNVRHLDGVVAMRGGHLRPEQIWNKTWMININIHISCFTILGFWHCLAHTCGDTRVCYRQYKPGVKNKRLTSLKVRQILWSDHFYSTFTSFGHSTFAKLQLFYSLIWLLTSNSFSAGTEFWRPLQTVWIQMRRHRTWHLIRIQTVCYSDSILWKKIEENANFRNLADDI